ncbi:uncharacterized protein TM35_000211170 [Trypanosoma theileri]|uniref:Uncharacterized protein n=1 Tax=Trypanosoma theileri TaxID=67003 RepID=A0A1X0NSC1_9TRYP|nr:uncharacterized protein TM35_000211170 [Trypanosoma theileri]ORC87511.1 hypothetical protein TM35_000211170 [Trypanosoma theileri]
MDFVFLYFGCLGLHQQMPVGIPHQKNSYKKRNSIADRAPHAMGKAVVLTVAFRNLLGRMCRQEFRGARHLFWRAVLQSGLRTLEHSACTRLGLGGGNFGETPGQKWQIPIQKRGIKGFALLGSCKALLGSKSLAFY